jgi:glyceraldehyde-3-phosphate dehydrogenase (NAD(P))
MSRIVHIVGTGTIGEPLIGLFTDFKHYLEVDEITFHKRTPLPADRARIGHLMKRGAHLATDDDRIVDFEKLGHKVSFGAREALERATVVIDCTPAGNENKKNIYAELSGPRGFLAQGSEAGFGKPYARGVNDTALTEGEDRFIQIVSCNTHNITTLVKTICDDGESGYNLDRASFVCMRRANDITQVGSYVPAPYVGRHDDAQFGTHHARDASSLFQTLGLELDLFSSAVKLNTQYMHSIWFQFLLNRDTDAAEIEQRLRDNHRVAVTDKQYANQIFSFGRDHGYYGRILSQAVVVLPTLLVRGGCEVTGFCFTPQDGNSLMSSIAAALWLIEPDAESVSRRISQLRRFVFLEI